MSSSAKRPALSRPAEQLAGNAQYNASILGRPSSCLQQILRFVVLHQGEARKFESDFTGNRDVLVKTDFHPPPRPTHEAHLAAPRSPPTGCALSGRYTHGDRFQ